MESNIQLRESGISVREVLCQVNSNGQHLNQIKYDRLPSWGIIITATDEEYVMWKLADGK